MFLYEPPSSSGDLHFRIAGVPVRIHPLFWLTSVLLGLGGDGETPPAELLIWIAVVLVSIVVHELGHAFVQRRFGGNPRITLYAMGGMAVCNDCDRSPTSQILISLAGPFAGFLLAAAALLAAKLAGHDVGVLWSKSRELNLENDEPLLLMPLFGGGIYWEAFRTTNANLLMLHLLWVNTFWGLVNLLPIYPLDGGRVAREALTLGNPARGILLSLQISAATAAVVAAYAAFQGGSLFTAIFFGYLAYGSYQATAAYRRSRW
jgi:Zn-dependent protease